MTPEGIAFFVSGEPRPFPKKRTSHTGMIYSYDKDGSKRGWMQNINLTAKEYMEKHNLEPFGEKDAVYLCCIFYRTRPKSCKRMKYPYKKPDVDNYAYAVSNALNGVCYWDDSRITYMTIAKYWVNETYPAGVKITIKKMGD